ncbi:MAG: LptF/LptG family permease [Candidatus Omnitrophica bacterium]|nr:LptF/LptG family permease [Candidatus Omnitrophota bacterium]
MKLITHYILEEFFKALLGCFLVFISLFWIIDLFEHLDEITHAKVPLFVLCDYYFSLTPHICVQISPILLMLAAMITLNAMSRHNEIIALKAGGVNLWRIFSLFLVSGALFAGANFAVNELVMPESYLHAQNLKEEYFQPGGARRIAQVLKNITLFGSQNRIYIIKSYDPLRQRMENVTISESDDTNRPVRRIFAQKAQWIEGYWIFYNCIESEFDREGNLRSEPLRYVEKVYPLDETPRDFTRATVHPELINYWQLKKFIRRLAHTGISTQKEQVVLANKIAFPAANFILLFFAFPFALTRVRAAGTLKGISISLIICFLYWGANALSLSLGKIGLLPPLAAAWLPNLLFGGIGLVLVSFIEK